LRDRLRDRKLSLWTRSLANTNRYP